MRILYIDIDSLRPDHLGCYGYHRRTSPTIDAIASEGVVFKKFYTSDAPCLPSRTALYSGRFGIQTGVVGHGATAAQPKIQGAGRDFCDYFGDQGLAGQLRKLGLHTTMISPFGQRHGAWHIYAGFNETHDTGKGGMESAEDVQPVVRKWLEDHAADDNWFLHINYWDPHAPYRVPSEQGNVFEDDPLPAWLDDDAVIARHRELVGPHSAMDTGMYIDGEDPAFPRMPKEISDRASMRQMIDGYDCAIRYVDDHIAETVAILRAAGVYDETAIIISADHGENQGELGIYAEHGTADQGTCRIPMIVKWPGARQGGSDEMFHYNVDLAPTLMELMAGERQPLWDGESFASAITDGAPEGRDEVILSQCAHVCQRSVRWGKWIYIRTYHDGFRLFPDEMLFDLEMDPHEQNDLASVHPEICREGAWRLSRWHDVQMKKLANTANDVVDPMWTVMREGGPFHARLAMPGHPGGVPGFNAYLRRLEETGRANGAEALRAKYAKIIEKPAYDSPTTRV